MLQRDGVVMAEMKVPVMEMMMMMIPMKSSAMVMTMAMISPLREGISPADFSLPESFSLSVVFASWRRQNISSMALPVLGFLGDEIREGGAPEVGQGGHTMPRRGRGGPAPWGGVGPSWPISASPFGWLRHLTK